MVSLPLLTLVCVVFVVVSVVDSTKLQKEYCPPSHVTCKCGRNGTKLRVPVRRCLKFDGFRQYCDDCAPRRRLRKICRKFRRCKTCNQEGCTECPDNKHGGRCNKKCDKFCDNGGTCLGPVKVCKCPKGYTGRRCEVIEDKECTIITKPANGNVTVTGRKANYMCAPGYILNGKDEVSCNSDGVWSFDAPTCYPLCPVPNDTDHMYHEKIEERDGMVLKLKAVCERGYKISGSSFIACSADGTWSSSPKCVKKKECRPPTSLANGYMVRDDTGNEYFEGEVVEFVCYPDYGIENDINKTEVTLTCQTDGSWDHSFPKCVSKPPKIRICKPPGSLDHGHIVLGSDGRRPSRNVAERHPGVRIVYKCKDGYRLDPNVSSRFCRYNGNWDPPKPPVCISENSCPNPVVSDQIEACLGENCTDSYKEFHDVETLDGRRYNNGTYMEFKCASSNRKLNEIRSITCLENGTWSDSVPECIADFQCGKTPANSTQFIAHGTTYDIEAWPWHAVVKSQRNNINTFMCGGALLGDSWILTAAHCVTKSKTAVALSSTKIQVELGRQSLNDTTQVQRQTVAAGGVLVHPKYSVTTWDSDIALIKLKNPVLINTRVKPVCVGRKPLPHQEDSNKSKEVHYHVITGFGKHGGDRKSKPHSDELRAAKVNVETNRTRCMQLLKRHGVSMTVTDNMFCAGDLREKIYTCRGDSGGPLVSLQQDKGDYRWFIQGVISWGPNITCGSKSVYTVLTKVSNFVDWIKHTTGSDLQSHLQGL